MPQLHHLHLRYCKMITDTGLGAIACSMKRLYSIDLSFCSRITVQGIVSLLESRQDTLNELRLQHCSQMFNPGNMSHPSESNIDALYHGYAGQAIVDILRLLGSFSNLSALDLRNCTDQTNGVMGFANEDPFLRGMLALGFAQLVPGFLRRPTRPSRLCEDLLHDFIR